MTTMQLTCPDPLKRQAPRRSIAASAAPFQPLDPGIVNETIPAFFIGRNKEGFWLARDVKGKIGGIFLFESSALSFARRHARSAGCATIFPSERFELDLENHGNVLAAQLGAMARLAAFGRQQLAAIVGKIADAIDRRSN